MVKTVTHEPQLSLSGYTNKNPMSTNQSIIGITDLEEQELEHKDTGQQMAGWRERISEGLTDKWTDARGRDNEMGPQAKP